MDHNGYYMIICHGRGFCHGITCCVALQSSSLRNFPKEWHETDEWEHSDRNPVTEVQRESSILLDVNTGNCKIHRIRCSPYDGRKAPPNNVQNKQSTVSSVLCSFRLILEILDKGEVSHVPHETVTLDQNSKMYIYYMNYSRTRINTLKQLRSDLAKQHLGGSNHTDHPQAAPHADARSTPEGAQHGAGPHARDQAAQSRVDESATKSRQQQRPQGGPSGTAFAQAGTTRQKTAEKHVPDPLAAAADPRTHPMQSHSKLPRLQRFRSSLQRFLTCLSKGLPGETC